MKADEVVQLYMHKENSRVKRPGMQLKGFVRLKELNPDEEREAVFKVYKKDLRYYDVISGSMLLEEGAYLFMAGASCADIRQELLINLSGDKTPLRDPYGITYAIRYDSYYNCFVHRGTKGHTQNGSTCMIPGKAGDDPDFTDTGAGDKVNGELLYRDFLFDRSPEEMQFRVCGVEDGVLLFKFCKADDQPAETEYQVPVNKSSNLEFEKIKVKLPDLLIREPGKYDFRIMIKGKIKLSEFEFF